MKVNKLYRYITGLKNCISLDKLVRLKCKIIYSGQYWIF